MLNLECDNKFAIVVCIVSLDSFRRVMPMATSKKDASLAGKQLKSKKSTKAEKSVAGSALSQTPDNKPKKPKKPKGK